jgi:2-oxoglutarate dehydrogenase E2 component (dihydrolipoamide succinyltransferase)
MNIELRIPDVGESIREVQIGRWLKNEGDAVDQDENIVELETDKASMELPAPEAGVLTKILKLQGDMVAVGEVIGYLEQGGAAARQGTKPAAESAARIEPARQAGLPPGGPGVDVAITPSARRALRDHGLTATEIHPNGPRIHGADVLRYVEEQRKQDWQRAAAAAQPAAADEPSRRGFDQTGRALEEVVPMSLIRRRIAERLVQAQQQAALLTTFNEIDMSAVQALRAAYRDRFLEKFGVKLGLMSFFVKAVVDALNQQPDLNAEIRGDKIVYRNYFDIGIAVGSSKGLVVPVLQFAERLSFAEIERAIDDFAQRAAQNKLQPKELDGGTFTITNGGIYGSLLSTPIVNPPQSGVLGLHAIQDRPVAREGQVVIRPMMYVALTYDHRLVDGREAVTFLKRIKEAIEDPARMLLEV